MFYFFALHFFFPFFFSLLDRNVQAKESGVEGNFIVGFVIFEKGVLRNVDTRNGAKKVYECMAYMREGAVKLISWEVQFI